MFQKLRPVDTLPLRCSVKVIKRIPRASRPLAATKFSSILNAVASHNDHASWFRLLMFSGRCLRAPLRGGKRKSLATTINKQVFDEADFIPPVHSTNHPAKRANKHKDPMAALANRVSTKLEEGDFKGAVRLACSEDSFADMNDTTYSILKEKHPDPPPDSVISPLPEDLICAISVSPEEVSKAIRSFPNGSAGGPDGLRPQHLKDMTDSTLSDVLLSSLASFLTLILKGEVPPSIRPFFFGASLTALRKKDGGVRPIAVGCTLRRLAAKIVSDKMRDDMSNLLAPRQLGFGVKRGAEAAVHAARLYINNLEVNQGLVKLDFRNAFNTVRRDKMLDAVSDLAPTLLPFVHSVYSTPSNLFWGDRVLQSSEGVQQGDPLGPLLFCLSLFCLHSELKSEFCVLYLDDVTLGGNAEDLCDDLETVARVAESRGLYLNCCKSEIICEDPSTRDQILYAIPGARVVNPVCASLLGSPIGDTASVSRVIDEMSRQLGVMGERLRHLFAHDALILLRHSFAIPKILYSLRTSPCFSCTSYLEAYDEVLRNALSTITNITFDVNDSCWTQASLPVKFGGLGIRSAVQLAPSAFLASAAGSSDLVHHILPPRFVSAPLLHVSDALSLWSQNIDQTPPEGIASHQQKCWDSYKVSAVIDSLLNEAPDLFTRTRLLTVSVKESGAWLNALPVSSLGLRMDDNTIRVAVGLRLGSPLCRPHSCQHCGAEVDHLATHGLSCRKSEGRHHRHAALNDIIHRALSSAKVPSRLEPTGLLRSDGKRPDGVTLVPWECGKSLIWDATCPDTFAPSYTSLATSEAGAVAAAAEERKKSKYSHLTSCYTFKPVSIETAGVFGPETGAFLTELGNRIRRVSGEVKAKSYLFQRLSVAIQRGNAASVIGTMSSSSELEFF